MKSFPVLHIDLQRLLGATERLACDETVGSLKGQHRVRFCQFVAELEEIHAQLQAALERNSSALSTLGLTLKSLAKYGGRIDTLRRKRDDLNLTKDFSLADVSTEGSSPEPSSGGETKHMVYPQSQGNGQGRKAGVVGMSGGNLSKKTLPNDERGRGKASSVDMEVVESEVVAQDIAQMAGRLKESSMEINKSLCSQTRILQDTGDAASANIDRVKLQNTRVAERLRKKRQATCASWTMMLIVVATFFATYLLVIIPFDKRRGPLVKFAHAAPDETAPVPSPRPPRDIGLHPEAGGAKVEGEDEAGVLGAANGVGDGDEAVLNVRQTLNKEEIKRSMEEARARMAESAAKFAERSSLDNKAQLLAAKQREEAGIRREIRMSKNAATRRRAREEAEAAEAAAKRLAEGLGEGEVLAVKDLSLEEKEEEKVSVAMGEETAEEGKGVAGAGNGNAAVSSEQEL